MKKLSFLTLLAASLLAKAQAPFPVLEENFYDAGEYSADLDKVMLPPSPLEYDVLFIGGVDEVFNKNGVSALAKEWQDFTGFVPIDGRSDSGYVVVNHERIQADAVNGDGGGMTVFTTYLNPETGKWEVVEHNGQKFRNVDFSNVGGTGANCGGIQTSWGQVWTAEEWGSAFPDNATVHAQGFTDTTDWNITTFNGDAVDIDIKRYENFQYMVEVDVENAVAIRKNYNMGRYDHEGGWIASDKKTAYLSDDKSSGSVLFRFVADVAEDFSKGQLSFYKQSTDGESGSWMDIPMTMDNMLNPRDYAFENGATVFMRLEWVEGINDETVFIAETGRGKTQSIAGAMRKGGMPAKHLTELPSWSDADSSFNDTYGRILRLNVTSGKIESAIEGGGALDGDSPVNNHLSSPDGLASTVIDGRTYLVVNEDMNPSGAPANPAHFASVLCEIYFFDITGDAPGVTYTVDDDARRFAVGPKGCETTGGRFTPDGKTYFVNIQHPATDNVYPFNHSVTIAVRGFDKYLAMKEAAPNTDGIPFEPVMANLYDETAYPEDIKTVMIPASPLEYTPLFVGGVDMVYNANGESALAKEWQDFTGYLPIDGRSDSGYVVVNHERIQADAVNGDGGGMTVFTVYRDPSTGVWEVVEDNGQKFRNVDFSNVGGTGANCGGIQTSWGQVWTAEEWGSAFPDNATVHAQGFTDTTDWNITTFNGDAVDIDIKRYENFQYMVEVDVENAVAIRKNYNMGRYDHEGGWIASDKKTAYLSDDKSSGSVLFRFVADVAEDFSKGQLSFYKQSTDGESGSWMDIPMTMDNMLNPRDYAFENGATVFMRLEWVEGINDETVFIAETGRGKTQSIAGAMRKGGMPAKHLTELPSWSDADSSFNDTYGRILRLNVTSGKIESAIEGGGLLETTKKPVNNHLSSPDGLASTVIDGRTYLMIHEDMNPGGAPANPAHFSNVVCEIYMVDITGDAPGATYSVDTDLHRFMVGPRGCETTGGRFTPDGSAFFVNIQHPATDNEEPFNHSVTMVVTGFHDFLNITSTSEEVVEEGFSISPNPVSRELYLNKTTDVAIYNATGLRVMVERSTSSVDVSGLEAGTYIIKTAEGDVQKLIVE